LLLGLPGDEVVVEEEQDALVLRRVSMSPARSLSLKPTSLASPFLLL
jgi:hypothetical protein